MINFFKQKLENQFAKDHEKLLKYSAGLALFAGGFYIFKKSKDYFTRKNVKDKHIFITGAASGIGKNMAIAFAKLQAKVSLVDVDWAKLQQIETNLITQGYQVKAIKCDLTQEEQINEAFLKAKESFGVIDILINNAGVVSGKKILEVTNKQIDLTLAVNTVAVIKLTKLVLPDMIKQNSGQIVTISSLAGYVGASGLVDYCASKFGAIGFNESLRLELNRMNSNIKTTIICPFYINTGMFDGVKSRFFPILDENDATNKIVDAILLEKKQAIIPTYFNLTIMLKSLCPIIISDKVLNILGINCSMDEFKGRLSKL